MSSKIALLLTNGIDADHISSTLMHLNEVLVNFQYVTNSSNKTLTEPISIVLMQFERIDPYDRFDAFWFFLSVSPSEEADAEPTNKDNDKGSSSPCTQTYRRKNEKE